VGDQSGGSKWGDEPDDLDATRVDVPEELPGGGPPDDWSLSASGEDTDPQVVQRLDELPAAKALREKDAAARSGFERGPSKPPGPPAVIVDAEATLDDPVLTPPPASAPAPLPTPAPTPAPALAHAPPPVGAPSGPQPPAAQPPRATAAPPVTARRDEAPVVRLPPSGDRTPPPPQHAPAPTRARPTLSPLLIGILALVGVIALCSLTALVVVLIT